MGKLKLKRGLYLQHRVRKDGKILFRWGHAPGLRKRGIRPFDLFSDGRPMTPKDLKAYGLTDLHMPPVDKHGLPLLHHGAREPLSLKDAELAAEQLVASLDKRPLTDQAPQHTTRVNRVITPRIAKPQNNIMTMGDLLDQFLSSSNARLANKAEATIRSYKAWRPPVDQVFKYEPCASVNEDDIEDWFAVMKEARGHRMAYGGFQLIRRAWNWGRRKYRLHEIIWTEIDAPKPPPKLRIASQFELTYLLRAMDDPASLLMELDRSAQDGPPARPELGDSLVFAIWTTQRASNVLDLTDHNIRSGRVRYVSTKNKTRLDMPIIGDIFPARIAAAQARRAARGCTCSNLVLNPNVDAPYSQKTHGKHFREARALAAQFAPSLIGEGLDDWGQPFKSFTFEDCRDTGLTRLLRADCTIDEIISWSNHRSANSLRELATSYLATDGIIADRVGDKLDTYVNEQGFAI